MRGAGPCILAASMSFNAQDPAMAGSCALVPLEGLDPHRAASTPLRGAADCAAWAPVGFSKLPPILMRRADPSGPALRINAPATGLLEPLPRERPTSRTDPPIGVTTTTTSSPRHPPTSSAAATGRGRTCRHSLPRCPQHPNRRQRAPGLPHDCRSHPHRTRSRLIAQDDRGPDLRRSRAVRTRALERRHRTAAGIRQPHDLEGIARSRRCDQTGSPPTAESDGQERKTHLDLHRFRARPFVRALRTRHDQAPVNCPRT